MMQDGEMNDESVALDEEIHMRVQAALEELRRERQPKLDMQARCIAKQRAIREELLNIKANL